MIEKNIGKVAKSSSIYKTAAWGEEDQDDFLNQVVVISTLLTASAILKEIFSIEEEMGRVRTTKYAARVIDIDILYFNDNVIHTKNLIVPHPQIPNRRFVLIPLAEVAPFYQHPLLKKTAQELLSNCPDKLNVQKN